MANLVTSGAVLVAPAMGWAETYAWDPKAQALHGLTPQSLLRDGLPTLDSAQAINRALLEKTVYSDNPMMDGTWIELLFDTARLLPTFSISPRSAASLIGDLADRLKIGDLDYTAAEREARQRAGRRHRAEPDALYWAHLWSLIGSGYRAPKGEVPRFGALRRKP